MKAYAAVRETDGHEWIDLGTISLLLTNSGNKSQKVDRECGLTWAKDNPVIRIIEVILTEGKTVFPI